MSSQPRTFVISSPEQAHEAANEIYQRHLKPAAADGVIMRVDVQEWDDDRSLQQNRFYWGPCLKEISEQARVAGVQYTDEAWHEFFKRQFLGFEIEKVYVAGRKRATIIRRLRSTTKLGVRKFSKYLDQLQAYAATELGVKFSVLRWEDFDATKWGRH
jgi:hypothetical protein